MCKKILAFNRIKPKQSSVCLLVYRPSHSRFEEVYENAHPKPGRFFYKRMDFDRYEQPWPFMEN